jgi:hypothetical protein
MDDSDVDLAGVVEASSVEVQIESDWQRLQSQLQAGLIPV